jgi:hypothetical protein
MAAGNLKSQLAFVKGEQFLTNELSQNDITTVPSFLITKSRESCSGQDDAA